MEKNYKAEDTSLTRLVGRYVNNLIDYDVFEKAVKELYADKEESKLNLKPFDLEAAKSGKPVCTRDGRSVRILCFDAKRKDKKGIIALVLDKDYPELEDLIAYPDNGNYGGHENDGDLMMMPQKKEGWIVIHKEAIYDKETAEKIAKETTADVIRIQKIEWEE